MKKWILALAALMFLAACAEDTKTVYGKREVPKPVSTPIPVPPKIQQKEAQWITIDGGELQEFRPQVDILFVVDNSESMKTAQENLSRNINRFVDGFNENKMIDYHVGVTSVWDSTDRFRQANKEPYAAGDLRPVRGLPGNANARFVTTQTGSESVLAQTLKIGILPYKNGGPEIEEIFTPIKAALGKMGRGAVNEGFLRQEALLAVVILTDSDDRTGPNSPEGEISPEQMANFLFEIKGNRREKVAAYGALVRANDPDEKKDPEMRKGKSPERIEQFIVEANSYHGTPQQVKSQNIMSITQRDFGDDLARIGGDLKIRLLEKEIMLGNIPVRDPQSGQLRIEVRYGTPDELAQPKGGQLIPAGGAQGWTYDQPRNSLRLSGGIKYAHKPGARFQIRMQIPTL